MKKKSDMSFEVKCKIESELSIFSKAEVELMQKACDQKQSKGCIYVTYNDGESCEFLPDNKTNRKRVAHLLED